MLLAVMGPAQADTLVYFYPKLAKSHLAHT